MLVVPRFDECHRAGKSLEPAFRRTVPKWSGNSHSPNKQHALEGGLAVLIDGLVDVLPHVTEPIPRGNSSQSAAWRHRTLSGPPRNSPLRKGGSGTHSGRVSGTIPGSPITTVDAMNPQPLLDIEQAAERLNVSHRFIRRLIAQHRIDYLKIGKFIRFRPDELDSWIEDQRVQHVGHRAG
ncbi:MAG: excisionase family DNA binding protein [Acidimicrobiales bacterium]